ncbi:hypothetical protein BUALT_Bualt07G0037100 [Buddleja alternifolia]|uniref:RING-type E3 ubiquitin transferase n=1 Tax=Buddleja alternifolia TaxID=168488 RepID=A0AAV6X948_9LAMI|nr:hypothetical protein BUALT_Bualt07G0037100 [Buddleja alternifolia]
MSPIILLVIVIVAIVFFALGLIQLLIRCCTKSSSFSSISQSNRFSEAAASASYTFQRQLQQLFQLHDSGLDQALIDALPIFYYKEIMGLKEPFDCASCQCEFSDCDKLKFLPNCAHAFHIHCIETWLLSNSTCPLCRSLIGIDGSMEQWNPVGANELFSSRGPGISRENGGPSWVFSIRLGKFFRSLNDVSAGANESFSRRGPGVSREDGGPDRVFSVRLGKFKSLNKVLENEDKEQNEVSSNSSIDARRCYSMGAFQYIGDDDAELQVELCRSRVKDKMRFSNNEVIDGKKIIHRESYSVSKIWLWSKKSKFSSSSYENESVTLPMPNGSNLV